MHASLSLWRVQCVLQAVEYERVLASGPRGKLLQFVYDVPGLIDEGKAPPIFKQGQGGGGYELNIKSCRLAEVHGCPAKNARGDLPAILLTPEADDDFAQMEPQSLAITRSIGDFYLQTFGVSWRPEVVGIDLEDVSDEIDHLTLVIASDGIWDLWEYEDVFHAIVCPPDAAGQRLEKAKAFMADTCVARGADMFDDMADNMTGIVVYLNPVGTKVVEPSPAAAATKSKTSLA